MGTFGGSTKDEQPTCLGLAIHLLCLLCGKLNQFSVPQIAHLFSEDHSTNSRIVMKYIEHIKDMMLLQIQRVWEKNQTLSNSTLLLQSPPDFYLPISVKSQQEKEGNELY